MLFLGSGALALLFSASFVLLTVIVRPGAKSRAGRILAAVMMLLTLFLAFQIWATFEESQSLEVLQFRGTVAILIWALGMWAAIRLVVKKVARTQALLLLAGYIVAMMLVATVPLQAAGRYAALSSSPAQHLCELAASVALGIANLITLLALSAIFVFLVVSTTKKVTERFEQRSANKAKKEAAAATPPTTP